MMSNSILQQFLLLDFNTYIMNMYLEALFTAQ